MRLHLSLYITEQIKRINLEYDTSNNLYLALYDNVSDIDDNGIDPGEIISRPSMALNQARNIKHRNVVRISNDTISHIAKNREILRNYKEAIDRCEFEIFFQPKVDSSNGVIVGAEALVRWRRGDEMVSPGIFIPPLEESGDILLLDYYVPRI